MPEGLIVKALSGYYYVKPALAAAEGNVQCRGRGIFKKKGSYSARRGPRYLYPDGKRRRHGGRNFAA